MELMYLYIGNINRKIKNQGICFSDQYDVDFVDEHITIRKKRQIRVFEDPIRSVNAISGKNGVGKTTILDLLGLRENDRYNVFGDRSWFAIYDISDYREEKTLLVEGENLSLLSRTLFKRVLSDYPNKNRDYIFSIPFSLNEEGEGILQYEKIEDRSNQDQVVSEVQYLYYRQFEDNNTDTLVRLNERNYISKRTVESAFLESLYDIINGEEGQELTKAFASRPDHVNFKLVVRKLNIASDENNVRLLKKILYSQVIDHGEYPDDVVWSNLNPEERTVSNYWIWKWIIVLMHNIYYSLFNFDMYYRNMSNYKVEDHSLIIGNSFIQEFTFFSGEIENRYNDKRSIENQAIYLLNLFHILINEFKKEEVNKSFEDLWKIDFDTFIFEICLHDFLKKIDSRWENIVEVINNEIEEDEGLDKLYVVDNNQFSDPFIKIDDEEICFTLLGLNHQKKAWMLDICDAAEALVECNKYSSESVVQSAISNISTGEKKLVQMFSAIRKGCTQLLLELEQMRYNPNPDLFPSRCLFIILIDEPDCYLHPEWERKFIWILMDELKHYKEETDDYVQLQVIFSTHSPIMLSDLPSENVICMNNNGKKLILKHPEKSFASNIFEIMNQSFFLDDFFGEFSCAYVNNLYLDLRKLEEIGYEERDSAFYKKLNELQKRVDIIGERQIRLNLCSRLDRLSKVEGNDTELKIFTIKKLLSAGKSDKEIADELRILFNEEFE